METYIAEALRLWVRGVGISRGWSGIRWRIWQEHR
jgi:hypothetical protein